MKKRVIVLSAVAVTALSFIGRHVHKRLKRLESDVDLLVGGMEQFSDDYGTLTVRIDNCADADRHLNELYSTLAKQYLQQEKDMDLYRKWVH